MYNNKSLRRALLTSTLAIVMCVSMLVGTTFAWFTDSTGAGVNTIQSGTLDVALEVSYDGGETWADAQGLSLEFVNDDGDEALLWAPGCTYSLPLLRVVNKGNLALKYKVLITGIQGSAKLNDVIDWTIQLDGQSYSMDDTHVLENKDDAHSFTISGHMDEDADDTYQNLTIEGISITIYATQYSAATEGSDDTEDAPLPQLVTSQEELNTLLSTHVDDELIIGLPSNTTLTLDNGIVNNNDVTFLGDGTQTIDVVAKAVTAESGELNYQRGSSFTFKNLTVQAGEGDFDGIVCDYTSYVNCTIKGKLTLYASASFTNCTFENDMDGQYSLWTWGATEVTVKDCVFNTSGKAILLYGSTETKLTVTGCTFNDSNDGAEGKAAIEVANDYNKAKTLIATDNTVKGFAINAKGTNTGTKLYGDKNSMTDAGLLIVQISGTQE